MSWIGKRCFPTWNFFPGSRDRSFLNFWFLSRELGFFQNFGVLFRQSEIFFEILWFLFTGSGFFPDFGFLSRKLRFFQNFRFLSPSIGDYFFKFCDFIPEISFLNFSFFISANREFFKPGNFNPGIQDFSDFVTLISGNRAVKLDLMIKYKSYNLNIFFEMKD